MSYWIYVTNSDNWAVTKKTNILGASARHKNALSRVNKGDKCLIYVKSEIIAGERIEPMIVAQYEIASTQFEDNKKIFVAPPLLPNENFDFRIRLKPLRVFSTPVEFKPLIQRLSFIRNKKYWTGSIRGSAIVKIPRSDYDLIITRAD
jgi:predicted RNA-binding protein